MTCLSQNILSISKLSLLVSTCPEEEKKLAMEGTVVM